MQTWEEWENAKKKERLQFAFGLALMFLAVVIALALLAIRADAGEIPEEVAVSCILGEARGESYAGMLAVAEAMRNRGRIKGVDGCGYNATDKDPIQQAFKAWEESRHTNTVGKADHWHADYITPYWAKYGIRTAKIGKHIFYKQVVKK